MNPTWRFSSAFMGVVAVYALYIVISLVDPNRFNAAPPGWLLIAGFILGGSQHQIAVIAKKMAIGIVGIAALWMTFTAERIYSQAALYLPNADPVAKQGFGTASLVGLVVAFLAAVYVFRRD